MDPNYNRPLPTSTLIGMKAIMEELEQEQKPEKRPANEWSGLTIRQRDKLLRGK